MYTKIVVPLDGSPAAESVLPPVRNRESEPLWQESVLVIRPE